MKQVIFLLFVMTLSACGSLPKQGAAPAQYDFGISPTTSSSVEFYLGNVTAPAGLDDSDMRYRLAYQNPTQVFAYTESRWAATPAALVARRLQQRWLSTNALPCSLNLTLEVFDQVFDSTNSSHAIVRLRANLQHKGKVSTTLIDLEQKSPSADARGGVAALITATDAALDKAVSWANDQECK
ncbi:MAG: hypothetical protein ACKVN9_04375 [Methylophilaceae bacterium]